MALIPGTRLGVYDIIAPIGQGGMGQVYRATDRTLGRQVAIKILPDAFAQDPESLARFEREAKTLAALNHPHIAAIYGFEKSAGAQALVMELVEGEDLSQRIAGRGIPIDEAVPIAKQIAEALEAAHEQGIIHRDLKPANVKITSDGWVKVLDFGLAKVSAGARRDPSNGPTLMATRPGLILGTAAYMAPEQARGEEADQASDMWAFGCVLFEMITGRRAFEGATMSEILANVLKTEPDWDRLPAETPDGVRRLLRRSLQKDQRLRFRDMRDARLEIDEVHSAPAENAGTGASSGRRERIAWASALTLVTVIAGVFGAQALRPAPIPAEVRLEINAPPSRDASLALSPDGQKVVYIAPFEGQSHLWLRSLDSPVARPLRGTEGASGQFWSPDSRSVGFVSGTRLKRVDIDGGSVQTLTSAVPLGLGASWNRDGTIIFANNPAGPLFRISAQGGEPKEATRMSRRSNEATSPRSFSPMAGTFSSL